MLESFHSRKDDVTGALRDLVTFAESLGAKSVAARITNDLVKKLDADRFHLVVVGEFNHGKTTFVNALLGASILPVGVTPTTAVIHHLEYAAEPRAEVVYASGERTGLPFEDVRAFTVGGERSSSAGEVKFLEVGYPAELLRERVVLVDTPGVNDLSLQRADITYSYIPRSDAVLFLIDAGQPLKESERVFLQEKLLGQSRDKILFVVTKRDIWSQDEEVEALAYIRSELGKLVKSPVVFPISSERALEGDRPGSGMPELLDHLTRFLAEERGRILLDNALGEGLESARLLGKGVDARRRATAMSREELSRRIEMIEKDLAGQSRTIEERRAGIREEVSAIRAWVHRDLDRFVDDVLRQLPAIIDEAHTDEIKVYLGAFLERTFAEWAQAETKEIATALEALAEKTIALVREDAHDVAKRVSEALGGDVKTPNVEVDTFGYDVGVFALFTIGLGVMFTNALLGGILALAAPVLAVYVKEKVEAETRKKAKEMAPVALREAATRIGPKLDEMIQEFASRLDAWVVTAGQELHREVIEVLKAAREERVQAEPSSESQLKACDAQAEALQALTSRLEGLRSALWTVENGESRPIPPPVSSVPNAPGGSA
ncbi:dynamin family protein [Sorangium atrum]|uniref:Dynamin family protein n=1 Tax=Sorangium atrum TaxID=2995308 RepID=A0ABT5C223_9BACT|nr:dynamin family protein [Sorangium aterium]MDC0680465.1 dynamin family protein [Sorangium aterium]